MKNLSFLKIAAFIFIITLLTSSCTMLLAPDNGHHYGWYKHDRPQKVRQPIIIHSYESPPQPNKHDKHKDKNKKTNSHR